MTINSLLKETVSYIPAPLYRRILAVRNIISAMPDPVLVYQMSKVGSSTVHNTLTDSKVPSLHVHFINKKHWKEVSKIYVKNGKSLPPHFHVGRFLRWWLNRTNRQVRVVTLIRDPIARNVSGAFQVGHLLGMPTNEVDSALQALSDRFASQDALDYSYSWFDREILPVFGVDVLDHPFNREEGFGRITREDVDILILTLEQLDDLVPTVLSDFVGQSLHLKKDRVRSDETYLTVKEQLRLEESTVRKLYDHEWMRHFYTNRDIERFVKRWSGE